MSEPWQWSASETAAAVRSGDVSASAVLESCLARTEQVEPLVVAYLSRFDGDARSRAAEIDRRRKLGENLGALAGVPVALKDNLALADTPLTCGSRILGGYVSPYSATAVERLLAADAVVLGKTNLDEFAMGSSCENSAFHATRNPWHLGMVPGGSSGGSAAAVAAGSVPLALGSDTGGSIRQPAALCGVVGLKPSYRRVSRYGLVAFGSSLDQIGPLTRSVSDAALALSVVAGGDTRDSTCDPRPGGDYAAALEDGIQGWRIGVAREVDISGMPDDSRRDWLQACERLESLGAELVEVSVPNLPAAIAIYYVIANCEASANLARFDGMRYGRRATEVSDLLSLYLASRSEGFGDEAKRRIMLGTFALSSGYYEAYYGRARQVLAGLTAQLLAAFEGCDLLASPTSPTGAFALGEKVDDPLTMYLNDIFTVPASLAGLPAISVPSGLDGRGLPLALQLMGKPFDEARLLRAARAFETTTGGQRQPTFAGASHGPELRP